MTTEIKADAGRIGTDPFPSCHLCGATGVLLYRGLQDCIRSVAGTWDVKRCPEPGCGLMWLDPMPSEADIGKAYRSYYTHVSPTAQPPAPGRVARLLNRLAAAYLQGKFGYGLSVGPRQLRVLYPLASLFFGVLPGGRDGVDGSVCYLPAPKPGARLLEVGFGDGGTLMRMRELGWNVVGVETDPVAVDNARARGLDVRRGGLTAHAFPAASFDAMYTSHVVEHVHDPLGLMRECHRILKPGGVAVMMTPNVAGWGHRRFRADWVPLDPPRHLMLFSPRTLRTLAKKAGFRAVHVRSTARAAGWYFALSEIYRQRGRIDGEIFPMPAGVARRATVQHLAENVLMMANPHAGDELVLIAKK